jgi:serine/threonine protein kinase/tetratricopeptide (TPR) repeat protein
LPQTRLTPDGTTPELPLTVSAGGARPSERVLERGRIVGRYVVLDRLGAGGMGAVFAAYDPELDRKVALKVLHPRRSGLRGRSQLLAEAQTLAKLSHPNVVTIHDVGTIDDDVWLAMELVTGVTLTQWLREQQRSWRDVADVIVPVCYGLAAAHVAGLVHCDIKPDNIMVDAHATVRVMDFGVARAIESEPSSVGDDDLSPSAANRDQLTRGGIAGTPGYMAPEQLARREIDGRTDQFSVCVVFWEALFGSSPFIGATAIERAASAIAGELRPVPLGTGVPRWLTSIVRRGLEVDPGRRFASMQAFIDALARDQARARTRRALLAVGGIAAVAALVFGGRQVQHRRQLAACVDEGAEIASVWNDDVESSLRGAMIDSGIPFGPTTYDRFVPWVDDWTEAWRQATSEACRRTVDAEWAASMGAEARTCLDERRWALEHLVTVLSDADRDAAHRAVRAAADLPVVEPCLDVLTLEHRAVSTIDAEHRDELVALRRDLALVKSLELTGRYAAALDRAQPLLERARALAWPPAIAEAQLRIGFLREYLADYPAAESSLADAYFLASDGDMPGIAADAATRLVFVVGHRLARSDDARLWGRHADLAIRRLPESRLRQATLANNLAIVADVSGAYDEARELHERALAIRQEVVGDGHPDSANTLNNLGVLMLARGQLEKAQEFHERALALREATLGPEHPEVGTSLNNLGSVYDARGAYAESQRVIERALALRERALGPDHPDVASSLTNLATVELRSGADEQAQAHLERAIAIFEGSLTEDHPTIAIPLEKLGSIHQRRGAWTDAQRAHERALAICEKAFGPEHPKVARALAKLADVLIAQRSHDEAERLLQRTLAIRTKTLGSDDPDVAATLAALGSNAGARGRHVEAVERYERALAIIEKSADVPMAIARTRFGLARALWETHRDDARALALTRRAIETFEATAVSGAVANAPHAAELAEMRAWLAAHR